LHVSDPYRESAYTRGLVSIRNAPLAVVVGTWDASNTMDWLIDRYNSLIVFSPEAMPISNTTEIYAAGTVGLWIKLL
jgi:hypothetical protein